MKEKNKTSLNKFTSDLIVRSYSVTKWELMDEFLFYFEEHGRRFNIIVPKGFITDFASVPRALWSLIPPTGRYTKATVLHDYLYSPKSDPGLDRGQCDRMFLTAMEVLGVKRWVRNTIFTVVRLFGNRYYKK